MPLTLGLSAAACGLSMQRQIVFADSIASEALIVALNPTDYFLPDLILRLESVMQAINYFFLEHSEEILHPRIIKATVFAPYNAWHSRSGNNQKSCRNPQICVLLQLFI